MGSGWTGHPGEPVPGVLRHQPARAEQKFACTVCGAPRRLRASDDEREMCPVAVAQRIAALEAHEASLHKYGAWVRGEIVRYLRSGLDRMWARVTDPSLPDSYRMSVQGRREAIVEVADAIAYGVDADWCEQNPEITPEEPR